ncbi:MAG: hypothetical protein G01um101448_241 [Parcubacteria group bacterium Gr01-1014_48]|nr:MAG: hypothetical protein Greene041614_75 [Parcubacteria group bacterium Greene0416_14]TSC74243.1 MAG: hypothetical protein G01um101448_241 [Parcubacteria group bacterium Gr01-1014_48]TSD01516.1 MAG: hypothetical protein Greene101415_232 [Parcubacteria group bacterium Greene1014_15]TSD08338.1 MAG: hypothetical protein Greene07144_189 [Parcubacteria group bacterium Greene0714_4]
MWPWLLTFVLTIGVMLGTENLDYVYAGSVVSIDLSDLTDSQKAQLAQQAATMREQSTKAQRRRKNSSNGLFWVSG